jgi:hypothetical protein
MTILVLFFFLPYKKILVRRIFYKKMCHYKAEDMELNYDTGKMGCVN